VRGLYSLKPWYSRRLGVVTTFAVRHDVSPDVFTVLGVVAAAVAALAIWQGWWLPALLLLGARLAGANLDGAIARARAVSRPWGFVLNEIGDRTSDLLMYAGLAALGARTSQSWTSAPVVWTLLGAVAATLPTVASLAAAGAGGTRRNGGPVGKTERCALAVLATALPGWLVWINGLVVVGSVLTAGLRLTGARRDFVGEAA
jgi:CDP-diacylglycerol--glycerol-3-phosphate 3-phosphatidyltransferase